MLDLVSRLYLLKYTIECYYQSTKGYSKYWRCATLCFRWNRWKMVKMTGFSKFIKVDNILVNIRPRIQAISPKVYIGVFFINPQKDRTDIEGMLRRVWIRIDENL